VIEPRPLLLVEDEELVVKSLERMLRGQVELRSVGTVRDARAILESGAPLAGAIFDVRLPDGSGIDLLESIRPRRPLLPSLLLTAYCNPDLVNRAFRVRAFYLVKPASGDEIQAFVRYARLSAGIDDERVRANVDAFAAEHALSPRETEVVALAARELTRKEIAPEMGISLATLDGYIGTILRKSGQMGLQDIARSLRRT
jgi:two-component system, NarL family, response regulator DevR